MYANDSRFNHRTRQQFQIHQCHRSRVALAQKRKEVLYIHNHHGAEPFKDLRNAMHQNLKKRKKMFMKKYCCDDVVKMAGVLR